MSTNLLDLPNAPNNASSNVVLETSPQMQQQPQMQMQPQQQPQPQMQQQPQQQMQMQQQMQQQPQQQMQQQPNINNRGGNMDNRSPEQDTMNKVIADIQQASISGATQLASRDMSMSSQQQNHMQDEQIKPNFIPTTNEDYINSEHEYDQMRAINNKNANKTNSLDTIYDEIQTPILIMLLFFFFQLPFFNKTVHAYLPSLYSIDGNPNVMAYVIKSIIFAFLYYTLFKLMKHFSEY